MCESLNVLGTYALIDNSIKSITENQVVKHISHIFQHELKSDDSKLAEQGYYYYYFIYFFNFK